MKHLPFNKELGQPHAHGLSLKISGIGVLVGVLKIKDNMIDFNDEVLNEDIQSEKGLTSNEMSSEFVYVNPSPLFLRNLFEKTYKTCINTNSNVKYSTMQLNTFIELKSMIN